MFLIICMVLLEEKNRPDDARQCDDRIQATVGEHGDLNLGELLQFIIDGHGFGRQRVVKLNCETPVQPPEDSREIAFNALWRQGEMPPNCEILSIPRPFIVSLLW